MSRIILSLIGFLYIVLGLWCAVSPRSTSEFVGFRLNTGGGQSEFFTVYGGLEFALGLIFLLPLLKPETTGTVLLSALIVHASLVVFRTISLLRFDSIPGSTYGLAGAEWVLLILLAIAWWTRTEV